MVALQRPTPLHESHSTRLSQASEEHVTGLDRSYAYKKALDNVLHSWLLEAMNFMGIEENLVKFCEKRMNMWCTTLHLQTEQTNITTEPMCITCGIYQGDSLSLLLFCIAMPLLSKLLNKHAAGYKISATHQKVSHLVYMDDLKLIATNLT